MTSKSDAIAAALVQALGLVNWDPAPESAFAIASRKVLTAVQEGETAVVTIARDGRETVQKLGVQPSGLFGAIVGYPFALGIGVKGSAKYSDTTPTNWQEQARNVVLDRATWSGLSVWNRSDIRPVGVVHDKSALPKGWVWSVMGFLIETIEDRP